MFHNLLLQSSVDLWHKKFVKMSATKRAAEACLHHLLLANQAKEVFAGCNNRFRTKLVTNRALVVINSFLFS